MLSLGAMGELAQWPKHWRANPIPPGRTGPNVMGAGKLTLRPSVVLEKLLSSSSATTIGELALHVEELVLLLTVYAEDLDPMV